MKSLEEVRTIIERNKIELVQRFFVHKLAVFGSYGRGEQHGESDVDILVEFSKPVGFVAFMRLEAHLSDLIGIKVDLVTRKALKPNIGKSILQELVSV
jgi:predicted nucleotidyltransferase